MLYLYLMIDTVAQAVLGGVVRLRNDEVARRQFFDGLNDPQSPMHGHPQDYRLLKVGTIDDTTGIITGYDIPQEVANGKDWLDANKESAK